MTKFASRPKRWTVAVEKAQAAAVALQDAFLELRDLQEEYAEWLNNLPDNLQDGVVAQKLQAVADLDLLDLDDFDLSVLDEAEAVELPRGFGKD